MRRVYVAESPGEAHLVAGLLDEAGIACVVEGEMLFGARGDIGLTPATLPSISVRDEDAARAAEVIAARKHAVAAEQADEPPDVPEPPRPAWHAIGVIVVCWGLVGLIGVGAIGGIAIPLAGFCCVLHVAFRIDRAS